MALDVQTNILNGQQSAVGTGGFDLRQILGVSNLETVPSALDTTSALTSSTTSAPSFDAQQEQLINEVNEMIDDMLANRTASGGDELVAMLASGLAARLPAGASTQAVNAILLEAERRDRIDGGGLSSNTWEELKERIQKERAEQAKMADFADDAMNGQLSTVPDRYGISQRDYSELNDELKTRDGQERFMSFLRMMYPNMSDADLQRFTEDARVISAVRSGTANDADRAAYNDMSPDRRDQVSGALRDYRVYRPSMTATSDVNVMNNDGSIAEGAGQSALTYDDGGPVRRASLSEPPSTPTSVAAAIDGDGQVSRGNVSLSSTFRTAAVGEVLPAPVAPIAPTPAPQLASNTTDFSLANM